MFNLSDFLIRKIIIFMFIKIYSMTLFERNLVRIGRFLSPVHEVRLGFVERRGGYVFPRRVSGVVTCNWVTPLQGGARARAAKQYVCKCVYPRKYTPAKTTRRAYQEQWRFNQNLNSSFPVRDAEVWTRWCSKLGRNQLGRRAGQSTRGTSSALTPRTRAGKPR